MASHSPGPVPDPWDRSPHCPSANHWRIQQRAHLTRQRAASERVGDNQYRQHDACPARATHGPLTASGRAPSKTLDAAPASPREYHPASSPGKIAQSERTGDEMSGSGITDAISPASRANGSRARRPSLARARIHRNMGNLGMCGAHPGSVAQVLVARKCEARSGCPRLCRVVQEPLVPS
jgi:hypothetical protein